MSPFVLVCACGPRGAAGGDGKKAENEREGNSFLSCLKSERTGKPGVEKEGKGGRREREFEKGKGGKQLQTCVLEEPVCWREVKRRRGGLLRRGRGLEAEDLVLELGEESGSGVAEVGQVDPAGKRTNEQRQERQSLRVKRTRRVKGRGGELKGRKRRTS